MDSTVFYLVCGVIITLGSVITAICTIYNFIKSPAEKYKQRHDQELKALIVATLKENLPELLKQHDKEVKAQYKADRDKYLQEIKQATIDDIQDDLHQIKILGIQYEALVISAKDVLRDKIMKIYNDNRTARKISIIDRERLDQYYKDYKALKGNSYIDKYYNRMQNWRVIEDDDNYDESEVI